MITDGFSLEQAARYSNFPIERLKESIAVSEA